MARQAEYIFDFGSPNAYFVHRVLPGIGARTGSEVRYRPCLLGGIFKATGNQAPMIAFAGVKGKMANMKRETARFIAKHGLTEFTMNPHFPVNTLLLMRGAVAADSTGQLAPYVDAGFHHMWEEPKKMDDPEIFVAAMTASGLDGAGLLELAGTPDVKAKLAENTAAAVERGVFGIPTIFVGDEMYFGKEHLPDIETELASD